MSNEWTYRKFVRLLLDNGYAKVRTHGSHTLYSNGTNTISINNHPNKMVIRRLIKENNLKVKGAA